MKIAILNVKVPFIRGGAEFLAEDLKAQLLKRGYEVDIIDMPFKWYPPERIIDSIYAWRTVDLTEVNGEKIDKVICLKFPAFYVKHSDKVVWLLHQHRQAYELWNTPFGDLQNFPNGYRVKEIIMNCDNKFLREAKTIFSLSGVVADRLKSYNNIDSKVLCPPPPNYELFQSGPFGDYIYYPSRIDQIKRQLVLIEALRYTKNPVKVVLSGSGSEIYISKIIDFVKENDFKDRVSFMGHVSEDRKRELYSNSLGVYFGAYDEDYGYITLEAFLSGKPVIVHNDAGGPLEIVQDQENGFIIENNPQQLAAVLDLLYENKQLAEKMGQSAFKTIAKRNINWDYIVRSLLS